MYLLHCHQFFFFINTTLLSTELPKIDRSLVKTKSKLSSVIFLFINPNGEYYPCFMQFNDSATTPLIKFMSEHYIIFIQLWKVVVLVLLSMKSIFVLYYDQVS